MKLLIVESPTKSRTLQSFLGKQYKVASSYGHIRDLPQKELGVDVEKNFKPNYVVPLKARKRVGELKKQVAKASETILATDEDREGEAIAWHLVQVLNLNEVKSYKRIAFHEITKEAIEEALKKPRTIDMDLVDAQQARRILDRLVGYKLSPFLWKKVVRGLSAGRVQSVAVRLVVERERAIKNFKPEEYWTVEAMLQQRETDAKLKRETDPKGPPPFKGKKGAYGAGAKNEFKALLIKIDGEAIPKLGIKTKQEAEKIVINLRKAEYKVANIEKKEVKRNPLPPFTTSTLQQDAWSKLKFSAKRTMTLAQNLYETGLITYHRTDSLNLSSTSQQAAKKFIQENFGREYWPGFSRNFKTKSKSAQEAHEAIRPTYPAKSPDGLKIQKKLSDVGQFRLYDLIWRRFVACQMSQAAFDSSHVDISAKNYTFRANGQTLKFAGFLKVYPVKYEETELPVLEKDEVLDLKKLVPSQHFTQPPPRYSEAALIKTLEKEGIGRPSTYAPILETIQQRNYAAKDENKKLKPTEIGTIVNDVLVEHFPKIVDIKFTAKMENNLDEIARGKEKWVKALKDFYQPFAENLKQKEKQVQKKSLVEKTDKTCPQCGSPLVIRLGKYGKFFACSNFPNCKYTENLPKPRLNIKCPKCHTGEIEEKRTKKGKVFYGCSQWPDCDYALWDKPTGEKCSKCGSLLVKKGKKIVCSNKKCTKN